MENLKIVTSRTRPLDSFMPNSEARKANYSYTVSFNTLQCLSFAEKFKKSVTLLVINNGLKKICIVVYNYNIISFIDPDISELQIKYMASSRGKGGQKINRQRNCCEIKHIPTGITVDSQDTRDRTENYERALLLLRYRVDLEVNKETGLAIAYSRELENFIENRKNEVNDDEIEKKQRLIRKEDELRQINIDNFRLEKYHVIESESKLVHVMTNISVHINSDRDKAMEELRLLVAQKTVHS